MSTLKRSPMNRSAWTPRPAAQWTADELPGPRVPAQTLRVADPRARLTVPIPKDASVRDKAYLRRVAALACAHCRRAGPSQAAHADEGKGMGIKASDHDTYPLCADAPGRQGCHSLIGASGAFTREQRRALERKYVAQTRDALAIKEAL